MKINYSDKIENIYNGRNIVLDKIKTRISKDNITLNNSINTVTETINFDDKNVKEYKSIIKAKQLIFELTEEISKATSVEEIVNLRKKINYYINKIKKELIKRNISQETYNQLYEKITDLRKNIAMYIRFLKRDSILEEIGNMYRNIDNLLPESSIKLKKLLANELRYNKRILKNIDNNNNSNISEIIKSDYKSEDDTVNKDIVLDKPDDDDEKEALALPLGLYDKLENLLETSYPSHSEEILFKQDTLLERIEYYVSQYHLGEVYSYDGNFLKKLVSLIRNIPRYNGNKKRIKRAELDYNTFYHGNDLGGFINYSKKRNSIKTALEIIFKSSRLSEREIECLCSYDKCIDWITEFDNAQNQTLDNNKKLVKIK